ncbi:MAG: hypothetical protein HYV75_08670 [Opitutae bacterium]|nr:hypothetical protein [Opitutae bacterium]
MKTPPRAGWFGLLSVFLLTLTPACPDETDETPATRPIQVASSLEAQIPPPLRTLLLGNPRVRFMITVDEEGRLADFLATEATHYELLPRAEEVLQQTGYAPALDRGKAVQSSAEVTVTFYDPDQVAYQRGLVRMPFGSTTTESSARRLYVGAADRFTYRRAEIVELDKPVEMLATKVRVLLDANGKSPVGGCVIEFFVDARGDVRMPRIISTDNDKVALSALLTLQQTRFAPITRAGGVPAYVKVRQPVNYEAPAADQP